jgi:hypothetical protein
MPSKTTAWENAFLLLEFNNVAAANIGNSGGLQPSSAAGVFYVSLHTADPGVGGSQNTSEAAYTGYARVAVARTSAGWTVTGGSVSPAAPINFPVGTGGGETVTYFGIGTAASGAGNLLRRGTVTPNITTGNTITPQLTTASAVTES